MSVKGNLVVGQSGGPTAVINNSLVGVIHEAMEHPEIEGIYGMVHGIAGILNEEFIDLRREDAQTLEILRNTPASALGTVRYRVRDADYERLLEVFQLYNVRYFFYIGGNDSMDTTNKISLIAQREGYELHAIGVPKTVDNDLMMTDHCPGYGSAARFVASAIRNTAMDTEAMGDSGPIKLMEIMGRHAGWLTAAAALARENAGDPPHLIYVPECPVTLDKIVEDVRTAYERHGYCVAAVSEGVKDPSGRELGETAAPGDVDAFGHKALGGAVDVIAEAIRAKIGIRARMDKPGYLQRSFAELMSSVDREEAYAVGRAAVRAAVQGETGKMITLARRPGPTYVCETGLAPLEAVANKERVMPGEYLSVECNDVTQAFIEYARPLIGGPLPKYARLAKYPVPKRRR
ncbi:MAG: 6-phosphofructokinase [Chloroflexi bacterium]|nr:6-phosphofructokinase [Chloroflexota bacterium]